MGVSPELLGMSFVGKKIPIVLSVSALGGPRVAFDVFHEKCLFTTYLCGGLICCSIYMFVR